MTTTDTAAKPPAGKTGRRTQAERRNESTTRMLDAALALLGERRSLDFSLAEVADRAGYSRGQPTHIFGSREEMIRQLVPHLHVRSHALFGEPGGRGRGLQAIFSSAALLLDDSPEQTNITIAVHVLLAEAASAVSPYRQAVVALNDAALGFIAENLDHAIRAGEVSLPGNLRAKSIVIMAIIRGALLQWLADRSIPIAVLRDEVLAALKTYLGQA